MKQQNKILALIEKNNFKKETKMPGCDKHYKEDQRKVREAKSDGESYFAKVREGLSERMTFKRRPERGRE